MVAARGDDIIGYGRARLFAEAPDDNVPAGYHLIGVSVRPDMRRRGVGVALMRARMAWIAERAEVAWSFADASDPAALALHARCGFEAVEQRRFNVPGLMVNEAFLLRAQLR